MEENILNLLSLDHQMVLSNLKQFQNHPDWDLLDQTESDLSVHMDFEEGQVYPLLEGDSQSPYDPKKLIEDHDRMRQLIENISQSKEVDAEGQIQDLINAVQDHIGREEGELFPQIKTAVATEELEKLANNYQTFQEASL